MCERLGFRKEYLVGILNTLEEIAEPLDTMEEFAKRLKYLEKCMKESRFNNNGNAVTLSTFHSSKGLEFTCVYMVDLIEGVIPSSDDSKKQKDQNADMEEAVRLFYVGMTRAKQLLELISYNRRNGELVQQSQFVTDVRNIQDPPKEIPSKPSGVKVRGAKPSVPYNPNAIRNAEQLTPGMKIQHRVFGKGEIVQTDGDSIEIRFHVETKRLSMNICIEMGLLEPL